MFLTTVGKYFPQRQSYLNRWRLYRSCLTYSLGNEVKKARKAYSRTDTTLSSWAGWSHLHTSFHLYFPTDDSQTFNFRRVCSPEPQTHLLKCLLSVSTRIPYRLQQIQHIKLNLLTSLWNLLLLCSHSASRYHQLWPPKPEITRLFPHFAILPQNPHSNQSNWSPGHFHSFSNLYRPSSILLTILES